jgi:putative transposase
MNRRRTQQARRPMRRPNSMPRPGAVAGDPLLRTKDRCLELTVRGTLTAWVWERYPQARKHAVGKAGRAPHSLASKRAAVYELCARQGSAKAIAQSLNVDRVTLYNWKNQLLGRDVPASMKPLKDRPAETNKAELERQVESLRRDIRHLQLEHDLLKKANEIQRKDLGVDLLLLTNREKALLVDDLRETYLLAELLHVLCLPRSSYF